MTATSRLSVLFAIPALDKGGPDRVFFELLRGLDRARFAPSLVVSGGGGYYLDRLPADVVVHRLPAEHGVMSRYPLWPLVRLVRRLCPDVILATLRMTMTVGLARPLFSRRTAIVSRVANQVSSNYAELRQQRPVKHRLSQRLQLAALAAADRIVCQSRDMLEDLKRLGVRVPMTVIGNPIEVEAIAHQATPADRLPGSPALISVGRLMPQKGFDILLDAFATLRRRHPQAVLTVVGDGPERACLDARCRASDLVGSVRFAGFVTNPYPMMAGADLFVLASRYEGFPNVALESLACGTPVVATDCPGGVRDVVVPGLTGWLAETGNPASLADTIDGALAQLPLDADKMRRFLRNEFRSARVVAAYEALLAPGQE